MNTQLSVTKTKKRLAYTAAFLIMLSSHYLINEIRPDRQYRTEANSTKSFTLCMDYIAGVEYYRLNCPVCRTLIDALSVNTDFN